MLQWIGSSFDPTAFSLEDNCSTLTMTALVSFAGFDSTHDNELPSSVARTETSAVQHDAPIFRHLLKFLANFREVRADPRVELEPERLFELKTSGFIIEKGILVTLL